MRVRTNVVIITFNALAYTKATLGSLFENTKTPYHLTIVDNASDDGSLEYLSSLALPAECKKYTLIKNSENTGVGYAYNQGQQVSFKGGLEYTAFCNNDLYLSEGWLHKLEARLDENSNIAMLSPLRPSAKVLYDGIVSTRDRLMQIPETSDWTEELQEYMGMPIDMFNNFCDVIVKNNGGGSLEVISFPDSLSTCVCLTRNSHFKELNRFADPRFTGYGGEDIDMSWTMMMRGYDCAVDHAVYVHHFRGKSLKANKLNRSELLKKSNKILYAKWSTEISKLIEEKIDDGIDVVSLINEGQNTKYWLLHELNRDVNLVKDYI